MTWSEAHQPNYEKDWEHGGSKRVGQLIEHVRTHGYEAKYYTRKIKYFDKDDRIFSTMGVPVENALINNRCPKESTFEESKIVGTLPKHAKVRRGIVKHTNGVKINTQIKVDWTKDG